MDLHRSAAGEMEERGGGRGSGDLTELWMSRD